MFCITTIKVGVVENNRWPRIAAIILFFPIYYILNSFDTLHAAEHKKQSECTYIAKNTEPFKSKNEIDPRKIIENAKNLKTGNNIIFDIKRTLVDKNKKSRIRLFRSFSKKKNDQFYNVTFFLSPGEVKNTGILTIKYRENDKDDERWLYIPSLEKTKPVSGSSWFFGDIGFLGESDFSKAEGASLNQLQPIISSYDLDDFEFTFYKTKEKCVRGDKCWVIYAIPRTDEIINKTGYTKSILFVHHDNYLIIRGLFYMKDENYIKYLDVKKYENIDGYWVPLEIQMTKKRKDKANNKYKLEHKTILKIDNARFNQKMNDDFFTPDTLEKGPPASKQD